MGKMKRLQNYLARQSQQVKDKVAELSTNKYLSDLGIAQEVTTENVAKASAHLEKLIDKKQVGLSQTKINIVQGMYTETHNLKKSGKSLEEVFNFYWNIPEFKSCWTKLEFDELHLKVIIEKS